MIRREKIAGSTYTIEARTGFVDPDVSPMQRELIRKTGPVYTTKTPEKGEKVYIFFGSGLPHDYRIAEVNTDAEHYRIVLDAVGRDIENLKLLRKCA